MSALGIIACIIGGIFLALLLIVVVLLFVLFVGAGIAEKNHDETRDLM